MSFHLLELCAGSAALTYHLLGAGRQLVPYQWPHHQLAPGEFVTISPETTP